MSESYEFVAKVGLDCLPQVRRQVVQTLHRATEWVTTSAVSVPSATPAVPHAGHSSWFFAALGVVICHKAEKQGMADRWELSGEAVELVATSALGDLM